MWFSIISAQCGQSPSLLFLPDFCAANGQAHLSVSPPATLGGISFGPANKGKLDALPLREGKFWLKKNVHHKSSDFPKQHCARETSKRLSQSRQKGWCHRKLRHLLLSSVLIRCLTSHSNFHVLCYCLQMSSFQTKGIFPSRRVRSRTHVQAGDIYTPCGLGFPYVIYPKAKLFYIYFG